MSRRSWSGSLVLSAAALFGWAGVARMDANPGKVLWQRQFPVYLADIVTTRLGWAPMTADPETKKIYAHTTAGFLVCLDGQTGKTVWEHQLTEEYGRVTGYGGRVSGPICDSGLVIVGMAQGSWGSFARGANRFVALDRKSTRLNSSHANISYAVFC